MRSRRHGAADGDDDGGGDDDADDAGDDADDYGYDADDDGDVLRSGRGNKNQLKTGFEFAKDKLRTS